MFLKTHETLFFNVFLGRPARPVGPAGRATAAAGALPSLSGGRRGRPAQSAGPSGAATTRGVPFFKCTCPFEKGEVAGQKNIEKDIEKH